MKLAQSSEVVGDPITGTGPLGLEGQAGTSISDLLNRVITILVGIFTIVASIYFLFQLISGAYIWIGAGGDKVAIENARKKILNGFIGLAVVIAAVFLLDFLGEVLGIPYLTSPGQFILDTMDFISGG